MGYARIRRKKICVSKNKRNQLPQNNLERNSRLKQYAHYAR